MPRLAEAAIRIAVVGFVLATWAGFGACQSGEDPMSRTSVYAPPASLAVLFNGEFGEYYAATAMGSGRELTTIQFFEVQADTLEINRLKSVGWEVPVPDGVEIFAASGGILRDPAKIFWAGWRTPTRVAAQSLMQEEPIFGDLTPADRLIDPPLLVPSKKMHQYLWRREGDGEKLICLIFSGAFGEKGGVTSRSLVTSRTGPTLTIAGPVPGGTEDRTGLAWVEADGEKWRVRFAFVGPDAILEATTDAIEVEAPIERQRVTIRVDPAGRIAYAFLARARDGGLQLVQAEADFKDRVRTFVDVTDLAMKAEAAHSGGTFYHPDVNEARGRVILLGLNGDLTMGSLDGRTRHLIREKVPLDYPFPIVASYVALFEARAKPDGDIELIVFK